MKQTASARSVRGTLLVILGMLCLPAAVAAPPVEEELPDGKSERSRGTVAPRAQPQVRHGVATGAGAAAGAARARAAATSDALVIEGEAVSATPSRGQVRIEDMSPYGSGWSGNRQLKWSAPGDGAMLMLAPAVPAGHYDVTLHLTQGPAYARLEVIGLAGVIPRSDVELYGPTLAPPAQVALGVLELGPERGFAIRILGRDPRATGYSVGLDKLSLVPVNAASGEGRAAGP
ncbi:MAG: hypothetical protein FJ191_08195 [Gammaproteobacteria bacterium]|nr:hypothetical protein [Gammaproteobacteria bacterium]